MTDFKLPREMSKQTGLELATSVSCDLCWNAETAYPIMGKCLCDFLSRNTSHGNSLRPTSEPVYASKEVPKTMRRRKGSNNVHMNMTETSLGCWKHPLMSVGMALNFGALALKTLLRPFSDVSVDTRPDETRCKEALSCAYSRVRKGVKDRKSVV